MLTNIFTQYLEISLSMSVIIVAALTVMRLLRKRLAYSSCCLIFALAALRLLVPFGISPDAPHVEISVPEAAVSESISLPRPPAFTQDEAPPPAIAPNTEIPPTPTPDEQGAAVLSVSPLEAAAWLWLFGAAAFVSVELMKHFIFTRRLRRSSRAVSDADIIGLYDALCGHIGIRRPPKLTVCEGVASALLYGFFRPRIALPPSLDAENAQDVLAHELWHYKRRDLYFKLLLLFANALHWFNPLVYTAVSQAHRYIELACDNRVLRLYSQQARTAYGLQLLEAVKLSRRNADCTMTTQFNSNKRAVRLRLTGILDMSKKRKGVAVICATLIACMLGGTLVACRVEQPSAEGKNKYTLSYDDENLRLLSFEELEMTLPDQTYETYEELHAAYKAASKHFDEVWRYHESCQLLENKIRDNKARYDIQLKRTSDPQKIAEIQAEMAENDRVSGILYGSEYGFDYLNELYTRARNYRGAVNSMDEKLPDAERGKYYYFKRAVDFLDALVDKDIEVLSPVGGMLYPDRAQPYIDFFANLVVDSYKILSQEYIKNNDSITGIGGCHFNVILEVSSSDIECIPAGSNEFTVTVNDDAATRAVTMYLAGEENPYDKLVRSDRCSAAVMAAWVFTTETGESESVTDVSEYHFKHKTRLFRTLASLIREIGTPGEKIYRRYHSYETFWFDKIAYKYLGIENIREKHAIYGETFETDFPGANACYATLVSESVSNGTHTVVLDWYADYSLFVKARTIKYTFTENEDSSLRLKSAIVTYQTDYKLVSFTT